MTGMPSARRPAPLKPLALAAILVAAAALATGCRRASTYDEAKEPLARARTVDGREAARPVRRPPAARPAVDGGRDAEPGAVRPRPTSPPAPAARPAARPGEHVVAPGESLWKISRLYGVSVADLCAANDLDPDATIRAGQTLAIPGGKPAARRPARPAPADDDVDVAPPPPAAPRPRPALRPAPEHDEPAPAPAAKPAAPPAAKPAAPAEPSPARKYPWPVKGDLLSRFGEGRKGVEIACDGSAFVRAIAPGDVIFADTMEGYGPLVIVDHGGGLFSIYGHNRALLVSRGERVAEGQKVARGGTPDAQMRSRVYFEIRRADRAGADPVPVEPTRYLQ